MVLQLKRDTPNGQDTSPDLEQGIIHCVVAPTTRYPLRLFAGIDTSTDPSGGLQASWCTDEDKQLEVCAGQSWSTCRPKHS